MDGKASVAFSASAAPLSGDDDVLDLMLTGSGPSSLDIDFPDSRFGSGLSSVEPTSLLKRALFHVLQDLILVVQSLWEGRPHAGAHAPRTRLEHVETLSYILATNSTSSSDDLGYPSTPYDVPDPLWGGLGRRGLRASEVGPGTNRPWTLTPSEVTHHLRDLQAHCTPSKYSELVWWAATVGTGPAGRARPALQLASLVTCSLLDLVVQRPAVSLGCSALFPSTRA